MTCPKKIKLFFNVKCNCCQSSSEPSETREPCRNSAHTSTPLDYFQALQNKGCVLHVTTITIGGKGSAWMGRKSIEDQYVQMKKDIKNHIAYRGDQKYVYHFEMNNSGVLHAHGIEYDTYQARFAGSFSKYGSRNNLPISFQEVRNLSGYMKYIDKENIFPSLTNVTKKDLKKILLEPRGPGTKGVRDESRKSETYPICMDIDFDTSSLDFGVSLKK